MDQINLTTLSGVAAFTTAAIGGIKTMFPAWVDKKEPMLALAIPVLVVFLAKVTGAGFGQEGWVNAINGALAAGLGAQVFHDKVVNPVMGAKSEGKA